MAGLSDLEGLQILQTDLLAISESRLVNVDRLWMQLKARVEEFRGLLDKVPRNEQSRKSLMSGTVSLSQVEYSVNEDFQQNALQLADALNLDEIDSARIILEVQDASQALGRSIQESAVIRFHLTREYLLSCFRLLLALSTDLDLSLENEGTPTDSFRPIVNAVLEAQGRVDGSAFLRKCLQSMADIKSWLQSLADKISGASVLGQGQTPEFIETVEYQRVSLVRQHETLGMIVHYLVKGHSASIADFEHLLETMKRADKYDHLFVHNFPALGAFLSSIAAPEGVDLIEARALTQRIVAPDDQQSWTLHYVHAAVNAWWLAEYSGRYLDVPSDTSLANVNLAEDSKLRSKQFTEALRDGAFDFLLSLAADVKSLDWTDPARLGLRQWLQRKAPALLPDSVPFSTYFQELLMEQLESFIDAFITNMPDVLRRLRIDEDEQRQLSQTHEHDLDLERFLVIISFAFEGRPDAGQVFWSDPESNLAGFLHWASRRASTPLVSAFCEMLQAISGNEDCATSAHNFLLDEGVSLSGKMRRSQSLSWNQIIKELEFFSSKIRDRPALPQSNPYRSGKTNSDHVETEPESEMMLESYLRLISRLCTESAQVRSFLLKHTTFHVTDLLYQLASSLIPSRLRACAFTTLRSLATNKTRDVGEFIWISLDVWISGGYSPGTHISRGSHTPVSDWAMESIFQEIAGGFEEPNAFIQLLNTLITPYENESGFNDSLPFPESLGSTNRMPGIDPYVDFVLGQVFGMSATEINDLVQLRLLRLTCLTFISTCLSSFNEDLVIFANLSGIVMDNAIRASDLNAYIYLHPFARVMEWIFNDRVIAVLFDVLHQDAAEVAKSSPDSPLVLCLLCAIEVVTSVLQLQSTYLNIVRATIKSEPTLRRNPVANSAYVMFEDAVLNHLSIIPDLGFYIGAGHPSLTVASLKLLERLATAPRIISAPNRDKGKHSNRNKAIAAIEANSDTDQIARSLLNELNTRMDVESWPTESSYFIKTSILDFLISSLGAMPDHPTIAHLLLGFRCNQDSVEVVSGSPFSRRETIFFAIVDFVTDELLGDSVSGVSSWLISLKDKSIQLLKILWKSPLTSDIVIAELQSNNFLTHVIIKELFVDAQTIWDGRTIGNDEFLWSSSAEALSKFLNYRATVMQYIATELRHLSPDLSPALKQRILSTLLGSTTTDEGQQLQHFSAFDFFDFMELEIQAPNNLPKLVFLADLNLEVCKHSLNQVFATYDLRWVEELIALRKMELRTKGQLNGPQDEVGFDDEARSLVAYFIAYNHLVGIGHARIQALEAWVHLMVMMLKSGGVHGTHQLEFILRTLQVILPKLERYSLQSLDEASHLANLAEYLLYSIEFDERSLQKGELGDMANDRLYELFCICLRAINSPIANAALKRTLYCIAYRYLTGMSEVSKGCDLRHRHSIQNIKAAGERLMDVVCDDAYVGEEPGRTSALLLLCAFVMLAREEDSKYVVESLVRLNFIELVVDSLKNVSDELRETPREDVDIQLSYYRAKFDLLFHICRTRFGAATVLNAGLFRAIRESHLFSLDPDIGVDIDDSEIVAKHYSLLIAAMRVINAAVLSRGSQNQHTLTQGRQFLSENRLSVLTVLKRSAKLGIVDDTISEEIVQTLVESYMYLISMTNYLDFEDDARPQKPTAMAFT
ncbi:MAG: hypothetical protein M1818_006880 [Claussenomyces sp. TS43310]|nr:MAG: hypothetical protein M1818_006880 [Claussenomyces sp. TS43310]